MKTQSQLKQYKQDGNSTEVMIDHKTYNSEPVNNRITGFWNRKKEKLLEKYQFISEEDLEFIDGKEKEMIEMLGYKLGKTKEELRNIIKEL